MGGKHRRGRHRRKPRPRILAVCTTLATVCVVLASSWLVPRTTIEDTQASEVIITQTSAPMTPRATFMLPAPTPTPTPTPAPAPLKVVQFSDCEQAAEAGRSLIPREDPQYSENLDRDGDGTACDRHGDPPTAVQAAPLPPPPPPPPPPVFQWPNSGFGGVKPFVAVIGHYVKGTFGVKVLGVGSRGRTSDHPTGYALDFMIDDSRGLGNRLAKCMLDRRIEYHVKYVIWRQRINFGAGWEMMEDRGGATANHVDHVHVSFMDDLPPLPAIGSGC